MNNLVPSMERERTACATVQANAGRPPVAVCELPAAYLATMSAPPPLLPTPP